MLGFEWPGEEIVSALVHRFDRSFDGAECRNHDHRSVVFPLAQTLNHIHAAYLRHHVVKNNEIGPESVELFEGFGAVIGRFEG